MQKQFPSIEHHFVHDMPLVFTPRFQQPGIPDVRPKKRPKHQITYPTIRPMSIVPPIRYPVYLAKTTPAKHRTLRRRKLRMSSPIRCRHQGTSSSLPTSTSSCRRPSRSSLSARFPFPCCPAGRVIHCTEYRSKEVRNPPTTPHDNLSHVTMIDCVHSQKAHLTKRYPDIGRKTKFTRILLNELSYLFKHLLSPNACNLPSHRVRPPSPTIRSHAPRRNKPSHPLIHPREHHPAPRPAPRRTTQAGSFTR